MREEYNGWPNRETWAAHLWITNDEGSYNYWCERAQELDKYRLADELKEYFESLWAELMENETAGSSVLNMLYDIGSLWRVDWVHVAEAFKE